MPLIATTPLHSPVETKGNDISQANDRNPIEVRAGPTTTSLPNARQVLHTAGRAAGIALLLDGGLAAAEAATAVNEGTMSFNEAIIHVAKEGATGAIATGFGILVAGGVVGLTGGLASPVASTIALGTALTARKWIREHLTHARTAKSGGLTVVLQPCASGGQGDGGSTRPHEVSVEASTVPIHPFIGNKPRQ